MISKSKMIAVAVAALIGMASPAFAEFLETGTAANNGQGVWAAPQASTAAARSGRLYDVAPLTAQDPPAPQSPLSPALTGAGSEGYNLHNETKF